MTISREQVTQALRDVFDPELGMSIVDLGLIYDVHVDGGRVRVTMTLTTQGCPLHDSMTEWVRRAVGKIHGADEVAVVVTFEPLWTPDRIARPDAEKGPSPSAAAAAGVRGDVVQACCLVAGSGPSRGEHAPGAQVDTVGPCGPFSRPGRST